jgi:hypothetical protein
MFFYFLNSINELRFATVLPKMESTVKFQHSPFRGGQGGAVFTFTLVGVITDQNINITPNKTSTTDAGKIPAISLFS